MENGKTPHLVSTQLLCAVKEDHISKVENILQDCPVKQQLSDYGNALCLAAREGHGKIVNLLLDAGCLPSAQDTTDILWFRKPIHFAAAKGHISILKQLLECNVDINCVDHERRTPLHWAAAEGCLQVAEFLIQNGAAINVAQNDGFTALHSATCLGHWKMCKYLLSQGALVNCADRDGWTPLHATACYGHLPMVSMYLTHGASVNQKTTLLETPLHLALCTGDVQILDTLIAANADLEARDMKGNTPFLDSVWKNHYTASQYLIDMGANVNIRNYTGQSALRLARLQIWEHFVNLLLDAGCDVQNEAWLNSLHIMENLDYQADSRQRLDELLYYTKNPRSLQQLCKMCIRQELGQRKNQKAGKLPLPPRLQTFLKVGNVTFH